MHHHAAGLARLTRRTHAPGLAQQLLRDHTSAALSARERALLDHAAQLTQTPPRMSEADLQRLRAVGLTDRDLLDLNLTVAYFAYVNRIAEGLGVSIESP